MTARIELKRSPEQQLVFELGKIAALWYDTKDPRYIKQYHDAYHELRALGTVGSLDLEQELPDELMPRDYLDRFNTSIG